MNSPISGKDRPWVARILYRNGDAAAIVAGQPVVLSADGTYDGVDVELPSTAGAAKTNTLLLGVAGKNTAVGEHGEMIAAGWCQQTRLRKMTKSAGSAIWASFPAGVVGDGLFVDTVNNAFSNAGSMASSDCPKVVLGEAYASATTIASDGYSTIVPLTATALTVNVKSYVRRLG